MGIRHARADRVLVDALQALLLVDEAPPSRGERRPRPDAWIDGVASERLLARNPREV